MPFLFTCTSLLKLYLYVRKITTRIAAVIRVRSVVTFCKWVKICTSLDKTTFFTHPTSSIYAETGFVDTVTTVKRGREAKY